MRTRIVRWLAGLACLGLIAAMGVWVTPVEANTRAETGRWRPFDTTAEPARPALVLLSADANAINLQAELPGSWVQEIEAGGQVYSRLYGDGYGAATKVGLPGLPVVRHDVEVPFGAAISLELVEAEYSDYSLVELGLSPIYPLQPPVRKTPQNMPFQINRDFYANGSLYPSSPVALGQLYVVRGHRVQTVEVWPVAYDPGTGTVRLYRSVTLRLRLAGSDMARSQALATRYASPAFEARLSNQVLNYNQGRPAATFDPDTAAGYLIITADAYYDAMLPFKELRESRGFDVTMVRCSEVAGGCLSTSAIKSYIQTAYDTWPVPPSYILLVGDTNTVATWTGPTIGTSTDLYYGTMDGADDWHPDIGRGRFPVRSAAQTTYMVDKYLAYASLTGEEPWVKEASFPATCDLYTVAEGTHNYVINSYAAPKGYTGHFPNDPQPGGDKLYCITYSATEADVIEMGSQGRWAIIYSGHGSYSTWELLNQGNISSITNYGMFPFVASHACLSGDFGQTEVFGETWVLQQNKGALVYWGSSTYSYWDEDDVLERKMFDSLFAGTQPQADVAAMTDDGLAGVEAAYPASARYYRETYNVLGDPAVKLFFEPDLPTFTLDVDPQEFELCKSGTVTSTVTIDSIRGYSETVYLETGPLPPGITATFDPASAQAPFTAELTIIVADMPAGDYAVVVTATDQVSWTHEATVDVQVVRDEPLVPVLTSPPDGAVDQPFTPTFDWDPAAFADSYHFQLARSPLFQTPIADMSGIVDHEVTPASPLDGGLCYWWRVAGENVCTPGEWAVPFHFATVAMATSFYDDMEAGAGNWTHQAGQGVDHWQILNQQSHSPTQAWFVPDDNAVTDTRLWNTAPIAVGTGSSLTFWHRYEFEGTAYDGAVLEISTNGGSTWTDLGQYITANGYNGTISGSYGNPLGGRNAWTGDLTDWTQVEVDLSSFAGLSVQIRWRLGCDSSVADVGWYIDDVLITAPLPPSPAPGVVSITPDSGSAFEQTPVQIEGSGFLDTPSVRLGDTWLLSVTLVSSTTLDAVVPAGMEPGLYDLTLTNGDCQEAVLTDAFTVTAECVTPTVTFESDSPVELGQPMHFMATVVPTMPVTFYWEFGGPGYGAGEFSATPVFTYTEAGTYTVTVGVKDVYCQITDVDAHPVTVLPQKFLVYLPLVVKSP
jgi:Peptidase family C25/Propeptide_C25/PKD domain/Immune inhibitor A-like, MAM domain/IPT/TIG domain